MFISVKLLVPVGAAVLGDFVVMVPCAWNAALHGSTHYSKHVMLCTFGNTFVYLCVHTHLFL